MPSEAFGTLAGFRLIHRDVSIMQPEMSGATMNKRPVWIVIAMTTVLWDSSSKADTVKDVKAESGKPVILGNFLSAPANCGSNPGPVPLPKLREKPSHGGIGLQIVVADVAATDACPARKIPSIAMFYVSSKDFVGKDSLQVEFEAGDNRLPIQSFVITVQAPEVK